ncbi:MAG: hypothetical protein Q4G57_08025 [Bacillota bacterium]|nr:hypothetical protein [Bacillota bacterium]
MQRQRIHRRLRDKIHSEEGFTLSETLMTVVLIGLITMAMAGGIVAAKNVYQRISLRADAQTLLATTVSAVTEDLSSVSSCDALQSSGSSQTEAALIQNGSPVGSKAFFYAESRGYRMQYRNGSYGTGASGNGTSGSGASGTGASEMGASGGNTGTEAQKGIQVVPKDNEGGSIPLLPDKVQTRGLYAYIESLSVTKPQSKGDGGYFTLKIQIKNGKKDDQVVEEATVCVHNKLKFTSWSVR